MTRDAERNPSMVLLFSGGLDTTLEAMARLDTHEVVHLLTFNNGWCINVDAARRRADELASVAEKARFHHEVVNTRSLLNRLLEHARTLPYHSPLVADLACKLAATAELAAYARRNGIQHVSDGAARAQTQIFIQHPEFTTHAELFLASYGVTPLPPLLFGVAREKKLAMLDQLGLRSGPRFLEGLHITSQLQHQPFCMRGILTFFFTSPTRHIGLVKKHGLSIADAKALWDDLLSVAVEYLQQKHGLSAQEQDHQK